MLINARHADELRVAIIQEGVLEAYEVEAAESGMRRGNIYRGVVAKVESSLNAAFIDYGAERHGFLPGDDIVAEAYHRKVDDSAKHPPIASVLQKGQPILVQVTKEAVGQKGAALTTNLSFAGRYMVLTPFDETRGVSRKVEDEKARKKLRKQLSSFAMPDGCGVIARTNALDQLKASLSRDLNALLRLWRRVDSEGKKGKGPRLLYSDQDLVLQALRDFLDSSIEEVYVDDDTVFRKAEDYMRAFMPRAKTELIRYEERIPLFARFHLDEQIARIYDRKVDLPSGGSIVIDGTEALTAIDVNSGKTRGGTSHEDTVARTNVEAAVEVARQLRMRDIGGLVVVDFIDMRQRRNHRKVEKTLRDSLKVDRARTSIGRISENGLLEINRQRVKQALELRTHRDCPTCNGSGTIASPEFVALGLLRRIETRAAAGDLKAVRVALHPELADGFQNHRRQELASLEREFDIQIEVIAATHLHRSDEVVEWKRRQLGKRDPDIAPRPAPAAITASDVMSEEDAEPVRGDNRRRPQKRQEAVAEASEGRSEDGTVTEKRSRRRRRGGRRRRKSSDDMAHSAAEAAPRQDSGDGGEPSGPKRTPPGERASGSEAGSDGPTRRRRPRRRRGRGRKGAEASPTTTPEEVSGNRLPPDAQDTQETEIRWPPSPPIFTRPERGPAPGWHTLFADEPEGEESKPRKAQKPSDEPADKGESAEAKPSSGKAEAAEEEAPKPRRRPSRRKKVAEEAEGSEPKAAKSAAASDGGEEPPEPSKPAKPRTRSPRTRKAKTAAEPKAAEGSTEAVAKEPAKAGKESTEAAPADDSSPKAKEKASGASKSRTAKPRTSRAAASKAASSKAAASKATSSKSASPKKAAASRSSTSKSEDAGPDSGGADSTEAPMTKAKAPRKRASRAKKPKADAENGSSKAEPPNTKSSREAAPAKAEGKAPSGSPPQEMDPKLARRPRGWPPLPGSADG